MVAPNDIWLDATLARVVPAGTPDAILAKRRGDRLSRLDAERWGIVFEDYNMSERITPAAIRPAGVDGISTAAIAAPRTVASPRSTSRKRGRR